MDVVAPFVINNIQQGPKWWLYLLVGLLGAVASLLGALVAYMAAVRAEEKRGQREDVEHATARKAEREARNAAFEIRTLEELDALYVSLTPTGQGRLAVRASVLRASQTPVHMPRGEYDDQADRVFSLIQRLPLGDAMTIDCWNAWQDLVKVDSLGSVAEAEDLEKTLIRNCVAAQVTINRRLQSLHSS